MSREIVIDTCVATSSSDGDAVDAVCSSKFLNLFFSSTHKAVFSKKLEAEWNRHESSFAKQWRSNMFKKNRIIRGNDYSNEELSKSIGKLSPKGRATENDFRKMDVKLMMEDLHLIEAALNHCKLVVSKDSTVRKLYSKATKHISTLKKISWYDLKTDADKFDAWKESDFQIEQDTLL
ncbi:MAG: hypothetical protein KIT34_02540 [Cyanobacteria bacterium TGS_CYA1]|nr:hypothetical protein [Cyanobacteria bacterium TGS_CYA1]